VPGDRRNRGSPSGMLAVLSQRSGGRQRWFSSIGSIGVHGGSNSGIRWRFPQSPAPTVSMTRFLSDNITFVNTARDLHHFSSLLTDAAAA